MTRYVITDPGTAACPAKNSIAAPGLPNQPENRSERNTMVGEQPPRRQVEQARSRALRHLAAARNDLALWVSLIQLDAQRRTGSEIPADYVRDPAYDRALDIYHQFITAFAQFEYQAAAIEAGETR